jgi:T5SS/PEP-CTERM-associated repeat protein
VISNGGRVLSDNPFFSAVPGVCVGCNSSSSNNTVVVTGAGSIWSNDTSESVLFIGYAGAGNSLVVKDGGQVCDFEGGVGHIASSSNNSILVTGPGSIWNNFDMGLLNLGNSLVVSNFGLVKTSTGGNGGTNNGIRVVDNGIWQGRSLSIGFMGSSNSLVIAGGTVSATNFAVGFAPGVVGLPPAACDNFVQLDSGNLIVTNATHDATLEVRNGKLILNGGVLQVDRLVMTNGCGLFVRTGGTLIVGTLVLDPNLSAVGDGIANGWKQQYGLDPLDSNVAGTDSDGDGFSNLQEYLAGTDPTNSASNLRIISIEPQGNSLVVTWTVGTGKTNALQATGGTIGGAYSTNGFTDIFVVTNTVGTITNYLDTGAVTNAPARYYRVRLVP